MSNGPGFYKAEDGVLLYAAIAVHAPGYTLLAEDHKTAQPTDGWQWFESEDDARIAYSLPAPVEPEGGALL